MNRYCFRWAAVRAVATGSAVSAGATLTALSPGDSLLALVTLLALAGLACGGSSLPGVPPVSSAFVGAVEQARVGIVVAAHEGPRMDDQVPDEFLLFEDGEKRGRVRSVPVDMNALATSGDQSGVPPSGRCSSRWSELKQTITPLEVAFSRPRSLHPRRATVPPPSDKAAGRGVSELPASDSSRKGLAARHESIEVTGFLCQVRAESLIPGVDPEEVVSRLARVAALYRDHALEFACEETITESYYRPSGTIRNRTTHDLHYIYTVEDPTDEMDDLNTPTAARLADYRTFRAEDGPPDPSQEVRLEELDLAGFLLRAYSWAFIFDPTLQPVYRYTIAEQTRAMGRPALVVAFEPTSTPGISADRWIGKVWIDGETHQLLRVEAYRPADYRQLQEAERARRESDFRRERYFVKQVVTEFSVEKNGMRFPSKVTVVGREFYLDGRAFVGFRWRERTAFRVEQAYSNYQFFRVRTETDIRERVGGPRK